MERGVGVIGGVAASYNTYASFLQCYASYRRQSSAKLERRGVYKVSPGPPIRASSPDGGSGRSSTGARADSMLAVVVCRKVLFLSVAPMRNGGGHAVDVGDNDRASAHKHESVKLRVCACVLKKACTGRGSRVKQKSTNKWTPLPGLGILLSCVYFFYVSFHYYLLFIYDRGLTLNPRNTQLWRSVSLFGCGLLHPTARGVAE